jgi:hypothetical protein
VVVLSVLMCYVGTVVIVGWNKKRWRTRHWLHKSI